VPTDVKHSENIGVVQRGHSPRLLLEAMEAICVMGKGFGKNLYGNIAPEPRVPSSINFAHAAGGRRRNDFIRPKFRARRESHPTAQL
jgi:hypothetical protein